jgi:hypothetical protein
MVSGVATHAPAVQGELRFGPGRSTLGTVASIAWAGRVGPALLFLFAALGTVSLAGSTGCGPSFQAVYECDVRFEHCYALDEGAASPDAMKECWRGWLHGYTYGQSRDRVEYAAARFSELSLDPTLPSVDTPSSTRHTHGMVAPLPTSAFAPPPNLAEGHGDGAPSSQPASDIAGSTPPRVTPVSVQVAQAPGEQCTGACAERWNSCRKGCADGACEACDRSYRSCVPGCFQEVRQAPRSLR